jgi:hypothetical protein
MLSTVVDAFCFESGDSAWLVGMTKEKPVQSRPRFRLTTPSDLVEAAPYLLGFEPEESLVLLSLRGKRSRLGLTARIDLPPLGAVGACATETANYLKQDKASSAVMLFYPRIGGPGHPVLLPLAEELTHRLADVGIGVREVLCICAGRWWSLLCLDSDCCPAEGTPIPPGMSELAANMTLCGRVVLPSRGDLARTIDPVGGVVAAAMADALSAVRAEHAERIAIGERNEIGAESLDLFLEQVGQRFDAVPGGPVVDLEVDVAARMIVGLDDVRVRDEIISWYEGEWGDAVRALLTELVRYAVDPHQVAPLTTLAWLLYLDGNGGFAGIALDRALDADPSYALAEILDQALTAAMNPKVFRASTRVVR